MSVYATNEYIIASNNSMNENKYNSEKLKNTGLKALLRPIMKMIKKTSKHARSSRKDRFDEDMSYEEHQNDANESLERKIISEMKDAAPGAAFLVYNEDNTCDVVPVIKGDYSIPVHFARTEAGTFFWTTVAKPADYDFAPAGHCYTECQVAEQQIPFYLEDRWVQA